MLAHDDPLDGVDEVVDLLDEVLAGQVREADILEVPYQLVLVHRLAFVALHLFFQLSPLLFVVEEFEECFQILEVVRLALLVN